MIKKTIKLNKKDDKNYTSTSYKIAKTKTINLNLSKKNDTKDFNVFKGKYDYPLKKSGIEKKIYVLKQN